MYKDTPEADENDELFEGRGYPPKPNHVTEEAWDEQCEEDEDQYLALALRRLGQMMATFDPERRYKLAQVAAILAPEPKEAAKSDRFGRVLEAIGMLATAYLERQEGVRGVEVAVGVPPHGPGASPHGIPGFLFEELRRRYAAAAPEDQEIIRAGLRALRIDESVLGEAPPAAQPPTAAI